MIKTMIVLLAASLAFIYSSCGGSDSGETPTLKKGSYSYVVTDSTGRSLAEGMIKIDTIVKEKNSSQYIVSGTYTISKMTEDTAWSSLKMMREGEFKGYYDKSKRMVSINTNPQIADANVFINAAVSNDMLKGGWYYSAFTRTPGRTIGGLFKATKK